MSELTTRELIIVGLYQTGWAPTAIARKLCIGAGDVRTFLKSPKAIAHLLEQEEATDQLIATLYRDGAEGLRELLHSSNGQLKLRAIELTFKALGKLKVDSDKDKKVINVEKFLAIINGTPLTPQELQQVDGFITPTSTAAIADNTADPEDYDS